MIKDKYCKKWLKNSFIEIWLTYVSTLVLKYEKIHKKKAFGQEWG